jgi:hypothetical protein
MLCKFPPEPRNYPGSPISSSLRADKRLIAVAKAVGSRTFFHMGDDGNRTAHQFTGINGSMSMAQSMRV